MKTLLITGFEPFGGETINPAWEAVKALPEQIGGWQLRKLQIPTVFGLAAARTLACAAECRLPFDPLPCARLYRRPRPALRWRARADRLAEASAPGRGPRPTASSGATGTVTGWEAPRRAGATGPRGRG